MRFAGGTGSQKQGFKFKNNCSNAKAQARDLFGGSEHEPAGWARCAEDLELAARDERYSN